VDTRLRYASVTGIRQEPVGQCWETCHMEVLLVYVYVMDMEGVYMDMERSIWRVSRAYSLRM
jgi:hypothetical protein